MRAEVCADILNQFFHRHALVYISVTTFLPPEGLPEWKQIEGIGQSANLGRSIDSSSHLTYYFSSFFASMTSAWQGTSSSYQAKVVPEKEFVTA
jgi:hypothetical protein